MTLLWRVWLFLMCSQVTLTATTQEAKGFAIQDSNLTSHKYNDIHYKAQLKLSKSVPSQNDLLPGRTHSFLKFVSQRSDEDESEIKEGSVSAVNPLRQTQKSEQLDMHVLLDHAQKSRDRYKNIEKGIPQNIKPSQNRRKTFLRHPERGQSMDIIRNQQSLLQRHGFGGSSNALMKQLCNETGAKWTCYQHDQSKCVCQGGLADCSGRRYRQNIAYAPILPRGVKCLLFRHNMVKFYDESFFSNVSKFEVIDLSYNDIQTISEGTFKKFEGRLKYLILNYNRYLKQSNIANVLHFAPTIRLDLVNIGLKGNDLPAHFFDAYSDISTQEFHFDLNFFPRLNLNRFAALKNIVFLSFKNCSIVNVTSASLPKLNGIDLDNNEITNFPETCDARENSSQPSLFSKLKSLYLNTNNIAQFPNPSKVCLPSVGLLGLSRNNISSFETHSLQNWPRLKVLYLDEMATGMKSIGPNAFSCRTLVALHVARNKINFSSPSISSRLFHNCSNLKVLYISRNNMRNVLSSKFVELFAIPSVRYLYLSSCHLKFVPSEGLSQLKNLEKLYLYVNEITAIPDGAFDSLTSLRFLRLDQNDIEGVKSSAFSQTTQERLVEIDLSANHFQCNCDILWFKEWLEEKGPKQFAKYPQSYTCENLHGKMVIDYSVSRQACLFSKSTYTIFVVVLSIFLAGFLLFVMLFRYRWHIRLAFYEWKARAAYDQIEDEADYEYDMFIVYCNDDEDWVLDKLLVNVEERWGHRAFIHLRDFQAGRFIIDNMVRAMNLSRRIVVVLSRNFARSRWCNFELQLCQSHLIEHDLPSLLVLQLEPIPVRDMTTMMIAIRNSTSFLEWPANRQDVPLFWHKLEGRMKTMLGRHRRQGMRAV